MTTPRVSYVIPCYNYARYVGQTIDSLLNQRYASLEVIVVNDASTDNTAEVLEPYGLHPRVTILTHDRNLGPIHAYNNGLAIARGELLGVFGADDYMITDHAVDRLVQVFDAHPEIGFVYSAHMLVHADGRPFREAKPFPEDYVRDGISEFRDLLRVNYMPHSGTLVRRSAHDVVGYYDAHLRHTGDWDMWLRLSARFDVGYVAEPLHAYRIHDTNMSHASVSPREANGQHALTIRKAFDGLPESAPADLRAERTAAITRSLLLASWNDRSLGRTRRAWEGLLDAAYRQPLLVGTPLFLSSLARLSLLTALGHERYERLAQWRGTQHQGRPGVDASAA